MGRRAFHLWIAFLVTALFSRPVCISMFDFGAECYLRVFCLVPLESLAWRSEYLILLETVYLVSCIVLAHCQMIFVILLFDIFFQRSMIAN